MPESRREPPPWSGLPRLSQAVLVHFAVLVLVGSWTFGGQSPGARLFLLAWGTVGIALFAAAAWQYRPSSGTHPVLRLLWPLWLYDLLVLASCFNPGFREVTAGGQSVLIQAQTLRWLPSAAVPALAARELWQFNGLVLSSFSLLLVVHRRGLVRVVLLGLVANAVVLAIFGTFQKLAGTNGLWFGSVPAPNPRYFATFVYHNHWGAFAFLHVAACAALFFHYLGRGSGRDFWHSPALLAAVATLLLAISLPLSASRSTSLLAALFLGAAFVHLLARLIRRRREHGEPAGLPVLGLLLAAALGLAAVGYLGREVIAQRSRLTGEQLRELADEGTLTSRLVLYRDTWRMAQQRPWFGWGLECYGRVFPIYNSQRPRERWFHPPVYLEAHNDWFQSLAETGFVGTGLLVLLGLRAVFAVSWRRVRSLVPRYLLAGAALLLLYAFLEFPFANPLVTLTFCATFFTAIRYAQLEIRVAEGID